MLKNERVEPTRVVENTGVAEKESADAKRAREMNCLPRASEGDRPGQEDLERQGNLQRKVREVLDRDNWVSQQVG